MKKTNKIVTGDSYVILGDALKLIKDIPDKSIHIAITDPPYFIDGMGDDWEKDELKIKKNKAGIIKGLPVGMKFDRTQGEKFNLFMTEISKEVYRVLKPGGFFLCFSQARLYHKLGQALDGAGFEIRDMLGWRHDGQAKAFSQDHFVRKNKNLTEEEKIKFIKAMGARKTPQLKPQIEPICLAQKPKEGTFVENWMKYEVGLIDVSASLDGKFPGNIMEVARPNKNEKGDFNDHLTVKPVKLIEHLLGIFAKEGQTVLDPFMGSGTTAVAAINKKMNFIGFEKDEGYFKITQKRIK